MKKKVIKKPAKKKDPKPNVSLLVKSGFEKTLTKEEFLKETEKISALVIALKSEMNERFEHHQNIILAEYRHRIEDLEGKVRKLIEG